MHLVIKPFEDRTYCARSAFTNLAGFGESCIIVQFVTSQPVNVLPFDEAVASMAAFVIVSGTPGRFGNQLNNSER